VGSLPSDEVWVDWSDLVAEEDAFPDWSDEPDELLSDDPDEAEVEEDEEEAPDEVEEEEPDEESGEDCSGSSAELPVGMACTETAQITATAAASL